MTRGAEAGQAGDGLAALQLPLTLLADVPVAAACGMSVREIQGHIRKPYVLDVSPELVSAASDAVTP